MRPYLILIGAVALGGCASLAAPVKEAASPRQAVQAVRLPEAPKPILVAAPVPLPLPGQLTPWPPSVSVRRETADPQVRVEAANAAARIQPTRAGYINAIQVFPFSEGALYQVYAAPGEVTDVALEAGEQLAGTGPVAAGDTVRWIIGSTESGTGAARRVHVLLKPTAAGLSTNLVINTDRRTYHLELRSAVRTYMASVSWRYPEAELIALRQSLAAAAEKSAETPLSGVDVTRLKFRYRIEGERPAWRPVQAFDDGTRVYIAMPAGLAEGEAPPLFVLGADGKGELVNYRVRDGWYVVDRLFQAAELRLGDKHQQVVRILRTDASRETRASR